MINIIIDITLIDSTGWDYPLEEIPYLIETHNNETFVYHNNRLYEAITDWGGWMMGGTITLLIVVIGLYFVL